MKAMLPNAVDVPAVRWQGGDHVPDRDVVVTEEPLEIRLSGVTVTVTMRTPGHDFDLACGFLFTEGIIRSATDVASVAYCPSDDGAVQYTTVNVNTADASLVDPARWRRNFLASASCGVCGTASIEAVQRRAPPVVSDVRVVAGDLYRMPAELRARQSVFEATGGLHAAGLFDEDGCLEILREDVGRHNAVDKVVGDALRRDAVPLSRSVLMVSGRVSFEIVQKALMAGIPIIAAVSAPSSLAVDLARSAGVTLVGFLRSGRTGGRCNVYTEAWRVVGEASA